MTNQSPGFRVVLQRVKGYGGGEQQFKMGAAGKAGKHAVLQQQQRVALCRQRSSAGKSHWFGEWLRVYSIRGS